MFARTKHWDLRKHDKFTDLKNWLPILLEPVPANYANLLKTYKAIEEMKGLPCAIPMNAAISFDLTTLNVPFADTILRKTHIKSALNGILDCEYSKKFFGTKRYEQCILKDPLPCGPVRKLVQERAPYLPKDVFIAMVQIDVDAYEYILLDGLVKELNDNPLPPIIHFENKVMKELDQKSPLSTGGKRIQKALETLSNAGYQVYEEGEDTLACLLPEAWIAEPY
ncbi:unnamed protein product [Cylindrotheca closterium]|uniref:Uncharacterized protein n=1 Tax=Cylindrotheca closterium TaxID=2856 RepID=A0AAD2CQP6_9STRA|nr:unnamed protein product [Cylindrotheca closterium]